MIAMLLIAVLSPFIFSIICLVLNGQKKVFFRYNFLNSSFLFRFIAATTRPHEPIMDIAVFTRTTFKTKTHQREETKKLF